MVETFEELKKKISEQKEARFKEKLAQREIKNFEEYCYAFKQPTDKILRRNFIKNSAITLGIATIAGTPTIIKNIFSKSKLEQKAERMINFGFKELPKINKIDVLKREKIDFGNYCPEGYSRITAIALINKFNLNTYSQYYNIIVHAPLSPDEIKVSISETPILYSSNSKHIESNYLHLIQNEGELEIYWDTTKFPITMYLKNREFLDSKRVNFTDKYNYEKAVELYETISTPTSILFEKNKKSVCFPIDQKITKLTNY
ncbi:MAG: hypothetical protein ABFQ65_03830 [Nanoarchaeota archaeon]